MMNIIDIIPKIKRRLNKYMETEVYKINVYPKDVVGSIIIAINLVEIAQRSNTKIRPEDYYLFNGKYQVSRLFDNPEWEDIGKLYSEFVSIAKDKYY